MKASISLGDREVGPGLPVFIIAEAGVNHNGDLDMARQLIDVAAVAGADAVKFQTFRAEKLVTRKAKKAAYQEQNTGDKGSQFDMLKKLELPFEAHHELKAYAEKQGILFVSTGFDEEAIDFLDQLGVPFFKSPSGELTNLPYLRHLASKGKPLVISTGMATLSEVDAAIQTVQQAGENRLVILHCTTNYPCPPEDANLLAMHTLADHTQCLAGYSDHTEGILIPSMAAAMGAVLIEKHFTLDRSLPGPDHKASLEPDELKAMVQQIRLVEKIRGTGEKKPTPHELKIAEVARKSIIAGQDISAGSRITAEMLSIRRPGTGISPAEWEKVIGKQAQQDIPKDQPLQWEYLL
jgi:N,N'-diacetyllegionaminate synthase